MKETIYKTLYNMNIRINKEFPRPSINYAKKHFKNKPITAIEIGVLHGDNSKSILETLNIKKLYLVDPYLTYKGYNAQDRKRVPTALKKAQKKLEPYKNKIIWIKEYSDKAITKVPNADFIYVDGNHEKPYVNQDIQNYWKKVNNNGILAGHDIHKTDVTQAVIQFMNENKQKARISREDWWTIKKEENKCKTK